MADFDELALERPHSSKRRVTPVNGRNVFALKNMHSDSKSITTSQYCEKLQEWMWQYYCCYGSWQSWMIAFPPCLPPQAATGTPGAPPWGADFSNTDLRNWFGQSLGFPYSDTPHRHNDIGSTPSANQRGVNVHGHIRNTHTPPGQEYLIPSLFHRFLAEILDFFILFFIKATIILSIIQFSGMKDLLKFAMHVIVEEIDDDTSIEELQKMMAVALVYRMLVCFYEIICIWGAGGATPGKFLLGLRVVTCNTSILVQPNRVCVVPASNVSLSASTVRAVNKNFSIAFFFPAFITLLFFQHNRTVYDIVAGTIVVKRNRLR